MYRSLRSRILLVVGFAVFATALSILYFARDEMVQVVTSSEEQHARDLLAATLLSVETEYKSLLFHREATLERRKAELKNIVTLAATQIDQQYQENREGQITLSEAQNNAIRAINRLRYDNGVGYIWINDLERPFPRMIMHPTQPELNGKLLNDPAFNTALNSGKNLFSAAVTACLENGEGYIDYLWPKPTDQGLTEEQPKISYVKLFEQWGWVLGTGVYIDDIEAETQKRLNAIIDELDKTFAKVRIAETGYMFLFNGKGEMLIHPNIVGAEFATMKNPVTGGLFFDELAAVAKTPDQSFDYLWDKPGFKGEFRFPKRVFMAYFAPLDWYIGASMYTNELVSPGEELSKRILYLGIITLIVAALVAIALARGMTKPLWKLAQSAKTIEQDGLTAAKIPISGTIETRELGQVLEQMVDSLRRTEEELRAANWELEAFVGTVSHDLRSPLTPIIGYAQFLQTEYQDQLDETALKCLTEIETQGERMADLIEDLLALAKTGYVERSLEPIKTEEVVRQVIKELQIQLAEADMEMKLGPLPEVSVPVQLLSQVFSNLITNAIRYAGHPGSPIEIAGEHKKDRVRLYVRDHGPGIPEHERSDIFQVFCRGSSGKNIKGTGLGLAIVQKVAQTYGGRAWVEETPGGGSTFWIEFKNS